MSRQLLFALSFIALFIFSDTLYSQKYWVMFKNKTGTPYSVSTPSAFLSPKAIARRTTQGISVDQTDLPVTPSYVSQVDGVSGVNVLYSSKWMNGVVITASSTVALTTINSFTFVQSTSPVNRYKITLPLEVTNYNPDAYGNRTQSSSSYSYGASFNQAQMLGVDCMHSLGWRGQGMTIAVLDAGFDNVNTFDIYDSLFLQNRLLGTRDFVTGDTMVFEDHYHGAACLSTMAGIKSNSIIGTAPKASYWLLRTEDVGSETISEEYNWIHGAEFADSVGADICTTSLGYTTFDGGLNDHTYAGLDGKTAPMSKAATMACRKGMLVLNAAGNEGSGSWYYIAVPADADSIITVGAVDGSRVKAGFSSHGPTADGRIKPDLVAQGGPALVCSFGNCYFGSGTSFSTPVLAGAIACLWQYKKFAKPMQLINALKATADSASAPNNRIGWGVPNMCAASASTLLSVPSIEKDAQFKIFPNPFSNELTIVLGDLSVKHVNVRISNILGQVLYSETISDPTNTIQLTEVKNYRSGIYFVSVSAPGFNITTKLVKQ